jgi:hypothetical protein
MRGMSRGYVPVCVEEKKKRKERAVVVGMAR